MCQEDNLFEENRIYPTAFPFFFFFVKVVVSKKNYIGGLDNMIVHLLKAVISFISTYAGFQLFQLFFTYSSFPKLLCIALLFHPIESVAISYNLSNVQNLFCDWRSFLLAFLIGGLLMLEITRTARNPIYRGWSWYMVMYHFPPSTFAPAK